MVQVQWKRGGRDCSVAALEKLARLEQSGRPSERGSNGRKFILAMFFGEEIEPLKEYIEIELAERRRQTETHRDYKNSNKGEAK